MNDKKIRLAFIGNGKSCNRYHVPFILNRPDKYEIRKIFTSKHSYGRWPLIEGTEYVYTLDEILTDESIDLVVISTPSNSHYDLAQKVLSAGKHCVVEKPFTESLGEAEKLFALAKQKGLVLQAYQNRRFDTDILTFKKVLADERLGNLYEIEIHYDYYRPEVPASVPGFSRTLSFVYGHAVHCLDQAIYLFGKANEVHYDVRQLLGKGRMNDYFDIDLHYHDLKVTVSSSYFRVKPRPRLTAYGKKGIFIKESEDRQEEDLKRFYLPVGHDDFGMDRPKEYGTLIFYDEQNNYHEEKVVSERGDYSLYYDALYETIIHGKEPLVKPEETLYLMSLLEEAISACQ